MRFVLFYHSLVSDWNHGNAHFLRGVASELLARGHEVDVYEPADAWSVRNLLEEAGPTAIAGFRQTYPELSSRQYIFESFDVARALEGADVVIVHEWNEPKLIRRVGECAASIGCHAFFHDTHHRSVTEPAAMAALDLRHYDGVLAFGETVAELYRRNAWSDRVWVWHEAADIRRFRPLEAPSHEGDVVWIGNWGDEERSAELHEFLIEPVARLRLEAKVYGVRYPRAAIEHLREAGIAHEGWLPNYRVPDVFSRHGCTVHVPRRAYASTLGGVPTIRMFEALACGIPLISAPWDDSERLFRGGIDYLVARDGAQMMRHLRDVLNDPALARSLAQNGLRTIHGRHTCAHRVEELLTILAELDAPVSKAALSS